MPDQFNPDMTTVFVRNEVPSGTKDFSNTTFTLVNTPCDGSFRLFVNNVRAIPTTD